MFNTTFRVLRVIRDADKLSDKNFTHPTTQLFWEEKPEHFLLRTQAMKYKDKSTKDTLINEHVMVTGTRKKHITISSTVKPHCSGLSTATKSHHQKRTTASSTMQTLGLKIRATLSPQ